MITDSLLLRFQNSVLLYNLYGISFIFAFYSYISGTLDKGYPAILNSFICSQMKVCFAKQLPPCPKQISLKNNL